MSKFFTIAGTIYFVANIILLFWIITDISFLLIINIITGLILGLALFVIGELIDRISNIEANIEISNPDIVKEDKIQQIECPICKRKFDIDYPNCPYCGNKNNYI